MSFRWYHSTLWNEYGLPVGLLLMLLAGLYLSNDCSTDLPHYDNTPARTP